MSDITVIVTNGVSLAAGDLRWVLAGGAYINDQRLKEWVTSESIEILSATYDAYGILATATVTWPDGSAGAFTTTTANATYAAVDAFTVTHAQSGKTVTQAAVTRDAYGRITVKPALTVA